MKPVKNRSCLICTGSVYDATQSYDVPFYMAGGFLIVASLISFGAQAKLISDERKNREKEEDMIK